MSKTDGSLPSYEESITGAAESSASQNARQGQRIINQLNAVRSQHIRSAIEQVCPAVEENANKGIARTVIILLPSDIVSSAEAEPSPFGDEKRQQDLKVDMSFSTDEDVRQIQLHGDMNRDFWTQAGVVDNFRASLQERLSSNPDLQSQPAPISPPVASLPSPKRSQKKSFFGRISNTIMKDVVRDDPQDIARQSAAQMKERIEVRVNVEEICLRTVTDFGLYETINRQGVIVRVHVRL